MEIDGEILRRQNEGMREPRKNKRGEREEGAEPLSIETMIPEKSQLIIPGGDKPPTLEKLLQGFATQQRVVTVITRRGERFHFKLVEVRKEILVGEVRCLNWSPEQTRKIYLECCTDKFEEEKRRAALLADAMDKFGKEAHRYRVYLPLEDIVACYEDLEDRLDETPFLPLP